MEHQQQQNVLHIIFMYLMKNNNNMGVSVHNDLYMHPTGMSFKVKEGWKKGRGYES